MSANIPLRHELKFFISRGQYELLSRQLAKVLELDPNAKPHTYPNGEVKYEYHIRSLYFDTIFDDAYYEKLDGVQDRNKYRIRIYDKSDKLIKLECKSKAGSLISKRSLTITRDLAEQIIAGDATDLEKTPHGLLSDVFREMTTNLLRPVVIVDYIREAYLHPAEEVRITFDKFLQTGMMSTALFDPDVPTISPFDEETYILEVKYNRVMPPYIRDLLCTYCPGVVQSAISKYTWCRRFEGKEA